MSKLLHQIRNSFESMPRDRYAVVECLSLIYKLVYNLKQAKRLGQSLRENGIEPETKSSSKLAEMTFSEILRRIDGLNSQKRWKYKKVMQAALKDRTKPARFSRYVRRRTINGLASQSSSPDRSKSKR